MQWLREVVVFLVVICGCIGVGHAQNPEYKLGATLWDVDSISHFAAPSNADIVVALHATNSRVSVIDAANGEVLRTFDGLASGGIGLYPSAFGVSDDGTLCILGTRGNNGDTSGRTRAFNVGDGRLLWERKETAAVSAISASIERAVLYVGRDYDQGLQYHCELVDTRDGHTIRTISAESEAQYVSLDGLTGRLYASVKKWPGQPSACIVEFDAETGDELRIWQATWGLFAKAPGRDTIYQIWKSDQVVGVSLIDLKTGTQKGVSNCNFNLPETCYHGSPALVKTDDVSGRVILIRTFAKTRDWVLPIAVHPSLNTPVVMLREPAMWEGRPVVGVHSYDLSERYRRFFFKPAGPGFERYPLVCVAMEPMNTEVDEVPAAPEACVMALTGTSLTVQLSQTSTTDVPLEIIALSGQVVLSRTVEQGMLSIELDIANLPAGSYICRVTGSFGSCSQSFSFSK